ncbi:MAG TPA: calcium-translocating P-type ATPase, PMCA-type [Clostridiales bacterium]|nr:calcium-translocating P-type ATPase, PMCA-type [Clostridiales bacterium]
MEAYGLTPQAAAKEYNSDLNRGLDSPSVERNRAKYGRNEIKKIKKKSLFKRFLEALSEPTLVILEFAWIITLGVNIGKAVTGRGADVYECAGILVAILISAALTVFMEGRSEKAFELLGKVYDKYGVKAVRGGKTVIIPKEEIAVGDILILETGDKAAADGRIIESNGLSADESMLTGESMPVKKRADKTFPENTPLAERKNMAYSGTLVTSGTGKMIVTAVGDRTELGKIAGDLKPDPVSAPLNEKLGKLGKTVTVIGAVASAFVFLLSVVRLAFLNEIDFFTVQDAFIEAIVLIVAAVPEGLPTTAAISLSLNVLKLAKSNALIRKLVAAETVGCVSVICSDKTGTLTENKMSVFKLVAEKRAENAVLINAAVNSSAEIKSDGSYFGSATEGALLSYAESRGKDYRKLRDKRLIGKVIPFNSDLKYMVTEYGGAVYIKGAPERVLALSSGVGNKDAVLAEITDFQSTGKRVIAFGSAATTAEAAIAEKSFSFDGYAVISDPVRKDVKTSIENCKAAGIKVMIMTGDNRATACAIAYELGLMRGEDEAVSAEKLEGLTGKALAERLRGIKVIARSTPNTKLKVVEALKSVGEVVAVTGDGVNDAPAIKKADVGIAMGSGSEITKEASDVVLLDDSFSTIVKAIAFGRNIYRNFQRFITFQLSVNATAMIVVIASLVLGLENPFNAVQLLWIDIIMDGPPALTLGMERSGGYMSAKPVKRSDGIVTPVMLIRIIIHGVYMSAVIIAEYLFDFVGAGAEGTRTAIFCMFVIFQLFNAFNCRKLGSESIFSAMGKNKIMVGVFAATFAFQIIITQFFGGFFKTVPLGFSVWIKIILACSTLIFISEIYKTFFRFFKKRQKNYALLRGGLN